MSVPWTLVVGGAIVLIGVITFMNRRVEALADARAESESYNE